MKKMKRSNLLKSATAPISLVIFLLEYSHKQVRKSAIRSAGSLPGWNGPPDTKYEKSDTRDIMAIVPYLN